MALGTIVTLFGLFENDDEWKLSLPEAGLTFLAMRLIQYLLGMALARDRRTSKWFICASNFLLFVVYWVCGSVVYWTAESQERKIQN